MSFKLPQPIVEELFLHFQARSVADIENMIGLLADENGHLDLYLHDALPFILGHASDFYLFRDQFKYIVSLFPNFSDKIFPVLQRCPALLRSVILCEAIEDFDRQHPEHPFDINITIEELVDLIRPNQTMGINPLIENDFFFQENYSILKKFSTDYFILKYSASKNFQKLYDKVQSDALLSLNEWLIYVAFASGSQIHDLHLSRLNQLNDLIVHHPHQNEHSDQQGYYEYLMLRLAQHRIKIQRADLLPVDSLVWNEEYENLWERLGIYYGLPFSSFPLGIGTTFYNRLFNFDLSNTNWSGLSLQRASISHAELVNSRCISIRLNYASLSQVNFSRSLLSRADFSHAKINNCIFDGASMERAQFEYSKCYSNVSFVQTDLSHSNLQYLKLLDGAIIDFSGANLSHANLNHVNLRNCDLTGANLIHARLHNTTLPHAKLDGAKILDLSSMLEQPERPYITLINDMRNALDEFKDHCDPNNFALLRTVAANQLVATVNAKRNWDQGSKVYYLEQALQHDVFQSLGLKEILYKTGINFFFPFARTFSRQDDAIIKTAIEHLTGTPTIDYLTTGF